MLPAGGTLLNISATESVEVEQDQLVATMRVESAWLIHVSFSRKLIS